MRCCVTGGLEINRVDTGREMGYIWTGCQSITEPTKRARQPVKFTSRFTANLGSVINLNVHVFGVRSIQRKHIWAQGGYPNSSQKGPSQSGVLFNKV